jgi:FHA domain
MDGLQGRQAMSDSRLDSGHLEFPRRQEYRRRREALLGTRGWLTLAAEQINGLVGEPDEWPVRPDQFLPRTSYLLVDYQGSCAYSLKTGLNTLGRLPNNDICFEETWISRRHCVILLHAWGGCELHDTASRNGTYVNGTRVERPVRLASGDWIKVCDRMLLFVSEKDYQAERVDDAHPATVVQ